MKKTGFVETAGDNTLLDISTLPSYTADKSFLRVTSYRLQASTADGNIITLKEGSEPVSTVICGAVGSGIDKERAWALPVDTDLVINLSAANRIYYSLEYEVN